MDGTGVFQFNKWHRSDYLDELNTPLYHFGYGLGYTTFSYSDLVVETPQVLLDGVLKVSAAVTNDGDWEGEETAQLYIRDLVGEVTRPVKELKSFQKVFLKPGESNTLQFKVPISSLGFHGLDNTYKVEPGKFQVWVGPNSAEGLTDSFEVIS